MKTNPYFVLVFAALLFLPVGLHARQDRDFNTLPRLSDLPAKYQKAAQVVAAVLVAEKEAPGEFRVEITEENQGRVIVFALWHDSAFEPKNKYVAGNPGGRCRNITYDTKTGDASASMFWQ